MLTGCNSLGIIPQEPSSAVEIVEADSKGHYEKAAKIAKM